MKSKNNFAFLDKLYPWILIVGGSIGLLASFVLTLEKIQLLIKPTYVASCNISPILSCTSIMKSTQAGLFGFPNPLIGIAGFAVVITIGVGMLAAARYKRWFMLGLQFGSLLGVVFVHWLFYESVFVIGALCAYCMVVWTVTIPIFLYTTLYNLRNDNIRYPKQCSKFVEFLQRQHFNILFVWYGILFATIVAKFWSYFKTLI